MCRRAGELLIEVHASGNSRCHGLKDFSFFSPFFSGVFPERTSCIKYRLQYTTLFTENVGISRRQPGWLPAASRHRAQSAIHNDQLLLKVPVWK